MKSLIFFIKIFLILFFVSISSLKSYANEMIIIDGEMYYKENDGNIAKGKIVSYGGNKYYTDEEDGKVAKKYLLEEYEDKGTYYFDFDGKMIKNSWLCIYASKVKNSGSYNASTYWYYFNNDGKAVKGNSGSIKKFTIDGKKYIFNEYGQMLTGFIDENGETVSFEDEDNPFVKAMYYCGDENDGVMHTGWYNYVYGYEIDDENDYRYDMKNIYLYFNDNGKKVFGQKKTINGKEYFFNNEGIMLSKWKAFEENLVDNSYYYGNEDDGAKAKQQWIYEVPSLWVDAKAYDDNEKKYFYYNKSGNPVKNKIEKIENNYFAFNKNGIMQKGLVIFTGDGEYIATVDFDYALAENFLRRGELATGENTVFYIDYEGNASSYNYVEGYPKSGSVKLYYFNDAGDRKTGKTKLNFSDYDLSFVSNNNGNKRTKLSNDIMIINGVEVATIGEKKYGIVTTDRDFSYESQANDFLWFLTNKSYIVVDERGKIVKGSEKAKKDHDDNYWLIGGKEKGKNLIGIWEKNVKYIKKGTFTFTDVFTFSGTSLPDENEIYDLLKSGGYLDDSIFSADISNFTLSLIKAKKQNEYYIKISNIDGYMYYDDKGDKKVWTPCGVFDRTKNTISVSDYSKGSYQVVFDDEFFVNCYWQ